MRTQSDRTKETRRQLYEAAIRLFREKGFDGASVEDISARAGCSRATFFNHFGSKSAVLRYYGQALEEQVCALFGDRTAGASLLAELRRILLAMAGEAEAQRDNLKIILAHSIGDGSYFSESTSARKRILQQITALISEAQKAGEVRQDLPAEDLAAQIMGLHNNAVVGILFGGQSAAAAVARLWEFALGGLTGAASAPSKTGRRAK